MIETNPSVANEDEAFRAHLAVGDFTVQRCLGCDRFHFPPVSACWSCGSDRNERVVAPPAAPGSVYSFTTCHRSFLEFADQTPYTVVLGDLLDFPGVRVLARLVGSESVDFGDAISLHVDGERGDRPLYVWRPGRGG